MLDRLGPGVAAAWSAASLGAAQPKDAGNAPLYMLLVRAVGSIGPSAAAHLRVTFLTMLGWALTGGVLSVWFSRLFGKWGSWEPWIIGTVAGAGSVSARLVWASALAPNPAPWAFAAVALTLYVLTTDSPNDKRAGNMGLLGFFLLILALDMDFHALILLPPFLVLAIIRSLRIKIRWYVDVLIFLTPPLLFFIPSLQPSLAVSGYYSAPQGIPEMLTGFPMLGWSLTHTVTIVPLILAIYGLIVLFLRERISLWLVLGFVVGILVGTLFGGNISLFAAMSAGLLVMILAFLAIGDIFNRLPKGLAPVALLLLPLIYLTQGPELAHKGEQIWEDHQRNVVRSTRYQSVILSTDEATVNAPRIYKRFSERVRPDIRLVNPLRLTEPDYIDYLSESMRDGFKSAIPQFDSLSYAAQSEADREALVPLAHSFLKAWVNAEVDASGKAGGVLVTPGYDPGTEHPLIPEGLLMRVWNEDVAYPFNFRQLKLEEVAFKPGQTLLEQGVIAQYPMMFTSRGAWMMHREYYAEGMDYIRYALSIDPNYTPARIVADEYNIHGDPLLLKPKQKVEEEE